MAQDKLKLIATVTRRFMGSANRALNAQMSVATHSAGSRLHVKACARAEKAMAEYDERYAALNSILNDLA